VEVLGLVAAAVCAAVSWLLVVVATYADLARNDYPRDMVKEVLAGYGVAPLPIVFFSIRLHALTVGLVVGASLFLLILATSAGRPMRLGGRSRRTDAEFFFEPSESDRIARRRFLLAAVPVMAFWLFYALAH
jgi:hypothetical protein